MSSFHQTSKMEEVLKKLKGQESFNGCSCEKGDEFLICSYVDSKERDAVDIYWCPFCGSLTKLFYKRDDTDTFMPKLAERYAQLKD